MRWFALLALAASSCSGLVPVAQRGEVDRSSMSGSRSRLTVLATRWRGAPYDLADYVTPIFTELANLGPNAVRVSYVDLQLVDRNGRRYPVLNPYAASAMGIGLVESGSIAGPRFRRFAPQRYERPELGAAISPSRNGPVAPLGYATWVWSWSPVVYPAPDPPGDVLIAGLPEGILDGGGSIGGFLYFDRIDTNGAPWTLTWIIHSPQHGELIGRERVVFALPR